MKVKFGICSDTHADLVHDGPRRVQKFLEACQAEQVEFCVDLGDFCSPSPRNYEQKAQVKAMLEKLSVSWYHVLGNHDKNFDNTQGAVAYLGMPGNYYSFDFGGIHFVVLDTCYYQVGEEYQAFDCGNYMDAPPGIKIPVLPPEELSWLEKDLAGTNYPSVLFSHHSLIESRNHICNGEEVRKILANAPASVILAASGHEHRDWVKERDGIWYTCINSMTYFWAGHDHVHTSYGGELEEQYPILKKMFPYEEPLYAIVEIDEEKIKIKGTSTRIVGQQPADIHYEKTGIIHEISSAIADKELPLKKSGRIGCAELQASDSI